MESQNFKIHYKIRIVSCKIRIARDKLIFKRCKLRIARYKARIVQFIVKIWRYELRIARSKLIIKRLRIARSVARSEVRMVRNSFVRVIIKIRRYKVKLLLFKNQNCHV